MLGFHWTNHSAILLARHTLTRIHSPHRIVLFSLYLQSEKPEAYKLEIELPYPIESEKSKAKFNKANSKLLLTMPVVQLATCPTSSLPLPDEFEPPSPGKKLVEVLSPPESDPFSSDSCTTNKKRRKRKKRRSASESQEDKAQNQESSDERAQDVSTTLLPPEAKEQLTEKIETCNAVKMHQVPLSNLIVPKAK